MSTQNRLKFTTEVEHLNTRLVFSSDDHSFAPCWEFKFPACILMVNVDNFENTVGSEYQTSLLFKWLKKVGCQIVLYSNTI